MSYVRLGIFRWQRSARSLPSHLLWLAFVCLALGLASCGTTPVPATPTPSPVRPLAGADICRRGPRFTAALGFNQQTTIGTAFKGVAGLAIFDPVADNGQGKLYQHATWDDAGYLGPWTYDRLGNIYTSPVPLVSLVENPPEKQNKVYKVDTDSQIMTEFVDLPAAQPPSGANPFGVVGLAYDCDTEMLYASSLAGSTAGQEVGRIFRIDLSSGQMLSHLDGVDSMGVGVYNGAKGKRLYYGLARKPEVWSIALDDQGDFLGEPRFEFSLTGLPILNRQTVRRIRFDADTGATLYLVNFNYSLQVASEREETILQFVYDPIADSWSPLPNQ